jgi:hypothetical protein
MDPAKVAQTVEVLNGLTARDALCLLVGCMLTVLDEARAMRSAGNRWRAVLIYSDALKTSRHFFSSCGAPRAAHAAQSPSRSPSGCPIARRPI